MVIMAMISRSRVFIALGCLFVLIALYGLLGFFQGIMLFTGERALRNANLWGSVFLVASTASVSFFLGSQARRRSSPYSQILRRVFSGVTFAAALWFLFPVFRDLVAIDSCLDRGGSFNHVRSICDFNQSHVTLSVFERQGFRVVAALVFALPALLAVAKWWQGGEKKVGNAL